MPSSAAFVSTCTPTAANRVTAFAAAAAAAAAADAADSINVAALAVNYARDAIHCEIIQLGI